MTDNEIINDFEKEIKYVRENEKYDDFNPIVDIDLCEDVLDLINRQKAEIETMQNAARAYETAYHRIKSEAIKDFAERLKEYRNDCPMNGKEYICMDIQEIDNLVKEMTEQKNNFNRSEDNG